MARPDRLEGLVRRNCLTLRVTPMIAPRDSRAIFPLCRLSAICQSSGRRMRRLTSGRFLQVNITRVILAKDLSRPLQRHAQFEIAERGVIPADPLMQFGR